MRELQQKQKIKHRMYSLPALLGMLVITILLARGAISIVSKERQSSQDVSVLKAKITDLTNQEGTLNDEIESLNTEAGIDEEIKDKFDVSAPGEHVAILIDAPNSTTSDSTSSSAWYKSLWNDIMSAL